MKKLKFLVALFTLLLLQSNLKAGSQLTGETKFKDKKITNISNIVFEFGSDSLDSDEVIRSQVTAEDVKPPMLVENRLMDFSAVQVYGTAAPGSGVIIAKKNNYYYVLTAGPPRQCIHVVMSTEPVITSVVTDIIIIIILYTTCPVAVYAHGPAEGSE